MDRVEENLLPLGVLRPRVRTADAQNAAVARVFESAKSPEAPFELVERVGNDVFVLDILELERVLMLAQETRTDDFILQIDRAGTPTLKDNYVFAEILGALDSAAGAVNENDVRFGEIFVVLRFW